MIIKQVILRSLFVVLLGLSVSTGAGAVVTSGNASAYGAQAGVTALSSINVTVTPQPIASYSAPPPGSDSDMLASLSASDSESILLTTYTFALQSGLLTVNAASDVDGSGGSRSATADASVENLDLGAGTGILNLLTASTLHLTADNISSNASVTGDAGSFSTAGSSVLLDNAVLAIGGVSILGAGVGVGVTLDSNPAPNTVLLDTGLISVTLNRQIENCMAGSCSISVDAIAIEFSDFVFGGGVINGDVVIAHSEASLAGTVVPVPAAAWLFGSGLLGLTGVAKRRRVRNNANG